MPFESVTLGMSGFPALQIKAWALWKGEMPVNLVCGTGYAPFVNF